MFCGIEDIEALQADNVIPSGTECNPAYPALAYLFHPFLNVSCYPKIFYFRKNRC